MKALLLDTSVIFAAFDSDDAHHLVAAQTLTGEGSTLATIDLARYEVANTAIRRRPELTTILLSVVDRIAADGGVVCSDTVLLSAAATIAEEHGISVYDAAYVAAARATGRTLVSCDVRDLVSKGLAQLPDGATQGS